MFDNFLDDFSLKDAVGGWLNYEQIKRGQDATGQSQQEVYNAPDKTQQVNTAVTPTTVGGLGISTPVLIGVGVATLAVVVLLVRK